MTEGILYGTYTEKAGELIDYDLKIGYELISEPLFGDYKDLTRYGIKITQEIIFEDGTIEKEEKEVRDIFYLKVEAEKFLKIIIKNQVTITGLKDVISEYITKKFDKI